MNLYYYQQNTRIPFHLHSHQHLLSLVFLIIAILTGMRWYLIVVLIYIYLMISDAKYLFTCLLVTCMSSSEKKSVFRSPFHSKNFLFIYLFIGCVGSSLLRGLYSSCSEWGLLSSWGPQASHRGGFSCCRVWSPGCEGFRSCGMRTLELWHEDFVVSAPRLDSTDSIAVARGLSCFVACGIFPDYGLIPFLLHWQADSLPLSYKGSPSSHYFNWIVWFLFNCKNSLFIRVLTPYLIYGLQTSYSIQ